MYGSINRIQIHFGDIKEPALAPVREKEETTITNQSRFINETCCEKEETTGTHEIHKNQMLY